MRIDKARANYLSLRIDLVVGSEIAKDLLGLPNSEDLSIAYRYGAVGNFPDILHLGTALWLHARGAGDQLPGVMDDQIG
jgi:hypothetical protein